MQTLEWCHLRTRLSTAGGFTLIEVLVVLVLIGLMAGVALPRLFAMAQRFEMASQRDALLSEIDSLGYRAYTTGKPIELGTTSGADNNTPPVNIPAGWQLDAAQPIRYSFNGICSGGKLTLSAPDGSREAYQLNAPRCKPEPIKAGT